MLIDRVLVCRKKEHTEYMDDETASEKEGASGGSPEAPLRHRCPDEERQELSREEGLRKCGRGDEDRSRGLDDEDRSRGREANGTRRGRKISGKRPQRRAPRSEEESAYEVTFEGAGTVEFRDDEVMTYWLYDTEAEIDLDQLRQQALERRFIRAALNYCLIARRTESSAADRMREYYNGYSPRAKEFWGAFAEDAVGSAVEYLREQGYIGDEKYAGSFVRAHMDKGVSAAFMENELLKRGVRRDAARAAVEEIREDDGEACRQALAKKVRAKPPVLDEEGRLDLKYELSLIRFLGSRGFSGELARKTVEDWAGARGSLNDE